jgi:hypothetical protein
MYGNCSTSQRHVNAGVSHDSLLGPIHISIYINDIPSVESDTIIAILLFADDTNISDSSGIIDIADMLQAR